MLTRRGFLLGGAATAMAACASWAWPRHNAPVRGNLLGPNVGLGHKLRDAGLFPAPARTETLDVVIVGGGIAGLAAGRRLAKESNLTFALLDMETAPGGNARAGRNEVSAYPWGAHYVPLVSEESTEVRALFEELGIITGTDVAGLPVYDEFYLCAEPHERLYINGRWQDGLVPSVGAGPEDEAEYRRFFAFMDQARKARGADGKRPFAVPLDRSSTDEQWRKLDQLSMSDWLEREGYQSPYLRWYVNYCCRDDYGTNSDQVSAWAGIHYFAARNGRAANADSGTVLTWPEGNGWLVAKLAEPLGERLRPACMATAIRKTPTGVEVDYWDDAAQESVRLNARSLILATPHFISARLLDDAQAKRDAAELSYAPWAVANVTLKQRPQGRGAALSWDNVIYDSPLLGYVLATHQSTEWLPRQAVLTYYWPLSHLSPAEARREALARSKEDWQRMFLTELHAVHPELKHAVRSIDIWVWGHAMIRPTPGFIWGEARARMLKQTAPIFTAHSDMSGVSIFEEAYTHGLTAAEAALAHARRQA